MAASEIKVTTYQYDCFDRRISKQVDSNPADGIEAPVTWFAYDGANVRLEFVDVDGSGAVPAVLTTRYFNGLGVDNVIAQENYAGSPFGTGAFWLVKNYQGSTTDIVKAADDGGFQNHITYDSYGNVLSQTNANASSRYLYTGREYDAETGLQYYRARYYDSTLGRFVSTEDAAPGFANSYAYVGGDPVGFVDPMGAAKRKLLPLTGGLMPVSKAKYGQYEKRPPLQGGINKNFLQGGISDIGGGGFCGGGGGSKPGIADIDFGPAINDAMKPHIDMNDYLPEPTLGTITTFGGGTWVRQIPTIGGQLTTGFGIRQVLAMKRFDLPTKYFNISATATSRNSLKYKGLSYLYEIDQFANPTWQMRIWKFGITSQDDPTSRPELQRDFLNTTPMSALGVYTYQFVGAPYPDRISARIAESQHIVEYRYYRGYPLLGNLTLY